MTSNNEMWNAKEKRMMHMNYFRTLCDFFKGGQLLPEDIDLMVERLIGYYERVKGN